MDIEFIPFKFLPRFMKDQRAKKVESMIDFVTDLKNTKEIALTYLWVSSPEIYLDSIRKGAEDYVFVPVSSSSSGYPENSWDYDLIEKIEDIIDKKGTVGGKLFKSERCPDIHSLLAKKDLIAEAKELGAEAVVGVKPQYTDRFLGHSVYLDAIALVPCGE